MEMYGKIVEGNLVSIKDTERHSRSFHNGIWETAEKTHLELLGEGWKTIVEGDKPSTTVYTYLVPSYSETPETIEVTYVEEHINEEATIALNTEFWNEHFIRIDNLMPTVEYYVCKTSYTTDGTKCSLINDDLFKIVTGAQQGQLTHLEVLPLPDFTQDFTQDYFNSITIHETNVNTLSNIIGFLFQKAYEARTIETLA